jgi:hypothetical protein
MKVAILPVFLDSTTVMPIMLLMMLLWCAVIGRTTEVEIYLIIVLLMLLLFTVVITIWICGMCRFILWCRARAVGDRWLWFGLSCWGSCGCCWCLIFVPGIAVSARGDRMTD